MVKDVCRCAAVSDWNEDEARRDGEVWMRKEEERALTPAGIAEQDRALLRRYREFRRAADAVTTTWRGHPDVRRVALIGSLARQPYKEVPRFSPYRHAGIALWHECKDIDLALWLDRLDRLDALRRAKNKALRGLFEQAEFGVADHQIDAFTLEPGSDRYLGRLCRFNQCPKGKRECAAPGCGAAPFLRQHEDFRWRPNSLVGALTLLDRASDSIARAADLPLGLFAPKV